MTIVFAELISKYELQVILTLRDALRAPQGDILGDALRAPQGDILGDALCAPQGDIHP